MNVNRDLAEPRDSGAFGLVVSRRNQRFPGEQCSVDTVQRVGDTWQ